MDKAIFEISRRRAIVGFRFVTDTLPFGRLRYGEPNAIGCAKFFSRSHPAVIRVCAEAGNPIEAHENAGEFKEC
jgi:hypothetical protein